MEFQKLRLTFSRAYPSLYSTIYPLSQVSAPSIFTREGVDNAYPIPPPSSTSFQDFARSFRGNETRWNLSRRRRRRLIQSMLIHSWNNTFETYRVYQISYKIVPRWIKEYLEIRVVECNIFRILIVVDSFRANVLSFPFAQLLGSPSFIEGENRQSRKYDRRDLSKRKERIHDKSFQRPIPNNGRLVEYHGSDVIAGNGDENCKVVHSIIELERFWLGRNPAVFFSLSLSPFFPSFVYQTVVPISKTYLYGTVRFRVCFTNVRDTNEVSGDEIGMGTRGKTLQNFSAKFGGRKNAPPFLPLATFPRTKARYLCLNVPVRYRKCGHAGHEKKWV